MVTTITMGFRAKLGDFGSLCNHVEGPKSLHIGNWVCSIKKSVSDLSMEFRAKLGDHESLCNHMEHSMSYRI